MSAITVDRSTGNLTASVETIEALKRLCAEDAAALRSSSPTRAPRPEVEDTPCGPQTVEETLLRLMGETSAAATESFALAKSYTRAGQLIEMLDVHIHQAARLTRAFAELVEAQARRRGVVVEHRHQHLHRRIP
jgi:hypothetical protein